MILFFVGGSIWAVHVVFRSIGFDYRVVALGALVPVAELVLGGPRVAHTLLAPVAVLVLVMVLTRNHRLVRRRWLGLPIGWMLHLVLDASFTDPALFWWPLFGLSFPDGPVPALARGWAVVVITELLGVALLVAAWRTFGLADPERRRRFLTQGRLDAVA